MHGSNYSLAAWCEGPIPVSKTSGSRFFSCRGQGKEFMFAIEECRSMSFVYVVKKRTMSYAYRCACMVPITGLLRGVKFCRFLNLR